MPNPHHHIEVSTLRESLGYLLKYKGQLFVIHLDGSCLTGLHFSQLVRDLALLKQVGIGLMLVLDTDAELANSDTAAAFPAQGNGKRVITDKLLPVATDAAWHGVQTILNEFAKAGVTGIAGNWVRARAVGVREGVDYAHLGQVEKVDTLLLLQLLQQNQLPIFPPLGYNSLGKLYYLSSLELAAKLGVELRAAKVLFLKSGGSIPAAQLDLPPDFPVNDTTVHLLDLDQAKSLLPKLHKSLPAAYERLALAIQICEQGVNRVHLLDSNVRGVLLKEIFSNVGCGTMVHANPFDHIRAMAKADVGHVLAIMEPYVEQGILLPRSAALLNEKIDDFVVYDVDGTVHACGALHRFEDNSGEIAGLAVDEHYRQAGIGRRLMQYLIQHAKQENLDHVFVLTTQTSDFFAQLGFKQAPLDSLPPSKKANYNFDRNSLVLALHLNKSLGWD
jgi:amino-acid N-acetyltransferase